MIEEARSPAWHVERYEAVQHPAFKPKLGQPPREQGGGGDRAGREQHADIRRPLRKRLDDREDRNRLANACRVQPDKPPGGPGPRLDATPLRQPSRELLSVPEARAQHEAQSRSRERRSASPNSSQRIQRAHSWSALSAAASRAAAIRGRLRRQVLAGNGDRRLADDHASAEWKRNDHAIPSFQQPPIGGLSGAGEHLHPLKSPRVARPGSSLKAWPARPFRGDGDAVPIP